MDLVIRGARYALACDDAGSVLERVDIGVKDGRVAIVGPGAPRGATEIDGTHLLVMPGLVNMHTHLAMTLLRGVAEEVDLQGFLRLVWAEEARIMDERGVYVGTRLGALEAVLSGTTTALDMYFHPQAAHRAAVEVGLRHVSGPIFFSGPGPDGFTWAERMAQARAWPEIVAGMGGPHVPLALHPHAPVTVGIDHLRDVTELAREQGALVHTHASENHRENEDTVDATGLRPVGALARAGVLGVPLVIAHGTRLLADETRLLGDAGAAVAHCPGSNLKLASGVADVVGYRRDGVRIGLGTDGCSSSNDLDMFAVMRTATNIARVLREDPTAISAREVVLAATIEGARALGLGDRIGTVEVGKEADLIALDLRAPHLVPVRDPYASVVFSAGRSDVRHVFVAGEPVVLDGRSTRVDEATVMDEAESLVNASAAPE